MLSSLRYFFIDLYSLIIEKQEPTVSFLLVNKLSSEQYSVYWFFSPILETKSCQSLWFTNNVRGILLTCSPSFYSPSSLPFF